MRCGGHQLRTEKVLSLGRNDDGASREAKSVHPTRSEAEALPMAARAKLFEPGGV